MVILIVAFAWLVLLFLTFRAPAPSPGRLLWFLLLVVASGALAWVVLIRVFDFNPNPLRVRLANRLTQDKFIDPLMIVPGAYDLNYIHRIDTDNATEEITEEWLVFYQYDVHTTAAGTEKGPFGAAIYDYTECRPPAILSYELIPVSYNYLGQDAATVSVANIIPYEDPVSAYEDRPEVIIYGYSQSTVTDINIFRKTGVQLDCYQWQQWRATHSTEAFPNPIRYPNIGSFRGNYRASISGNTVSVFDRSPFERSQITVERDYQPQNGSYFKPGTETLLDPVLFTLTFGAGRPNDIPQSYYPEKAVLAFYLSLGKDVNELSQAESYLSPDAQQIFDINTDQFGLALPRSELGRVLVWELRYQPNIEAELLHEPREVTVLVVGQNVNGEIDSAHPCLVTWEVVGVEKAGALPYGCEWRLEAYRSDCAAGK